MGLPGHDPGELLEWMTFHHLPLSIYSEESVGMWVVVDNSIHAVLGSGETVFAALSEAYDKQRREPS